MSLEASRVLGGKGKKEAVNASEISPSLTFPHTSMSPSHPRISEATVE